MATLFSFGDKLANLLFLARYRARMIRLGLTLKPIMGAEEPSESEEEPETESEVEPDAESEAEPEKPSPEEADWKRMARKHEREAKKARQRSEQLEQQLKAREDADKSEQEKAIEEAEQRARQDLEGKFQKERRQDRLEVASTKLAAKGVKVGSGDEAKAVKFADPDDALLHLERDIRNGDLDEDDIFDSNGRVVTEKLEEALGDLLARKPHLAAGGARPGKVAGSADAGKGTAAKDDEVTVESELEKIRRHKGDAAKRTRAA